ncbi:uncharacterized protein I303_107989 [Kwoniella dejecticola CBS 10117]|uniref:RING-type domain-containing protein n=1 Tax=Kwoniella dejecticola CBS 10117 TaxID=1296121 RepID=A0AAJ8MJ52_9TREE
MNTGQTGATAGKRRDDPLTSRGNTPAGGARRKARKKPKAAQISPAHSPRSGPIPTPYLALAPTPNSSLSSSTIDQLAATASSSNLILPSSYIRSSQERRNRSTPNLRDEGENEAGPSVNRNSNSNAYANANTSDVALNRPISNQGQLRQQKYVTSLLSPPMIIPGGTSATPRIQGVGSTSHQQPPPNTRRRSSEQRERAAAAATRRRSHEQLRELVNGNPSLTSLGQLGQILESGQLPEENEDGNGLSQAQQDVQTAQRRRRRIVRGDGTGIARRLTVSSREEGRAIGLARGASMRRTNVWDDIPEAGEPPPPFPFPTSSTSRLPPSFTTPSTASGEPSMGTDTSARPRSPPPTFEQAIGLSPSPVPNTGMESVPEPDDNSTPSTPRASSSARPVLSVSTSIPQVIVAEPEASPSSTHYASAPSSPTHTVIGFEDHRNAERMRRAEREDRRAWNEDLLAGYSLEERVRREVERQRGKEVSAGQRVQEPDQQSEISTPQASPVEDREEDAPVDTSTQKAVDLLDDKATPAVSEIATPAESEQKDNGRPDTDKTTSPPIDQITDRVTEEERTEANLESSNTTNDAGVQPPQGLLAASIGSQTDTPDVGSLDEPPSEFPEGDNPVEIEEEVETFTPTALLEERETIQVKSPVPLPLKIIDDPPSSPVMSEPERKTENFVSLQDEAAVHQTPKRRKPTRSSTAEDEASLGKGLSPHIKRLSVPEFSPFRPVLQRPGSSIVEPLFSSPKRAISPEIDRMSSTVDSSNVRPDTRTDKVTAEPNEFSLKKTEETKTLPPSREAAMKRRNLESAIIPKIPLPAMELSKPKRKVSIISRKESKPLSGPLINFDTPTPSPPESAVSFTDARKPRTTSNDMSALAASSAELLTLLELQDVPMLAEEAEPEPEPVAESSAQGAARMAKRPPPPPPSRNTKQGESRRETPTMPSPKADALSSSGIGAVSESEVAPSAGLLADNGFEESSRKPALPPRRAPPPPPVPRLNLIPKSAPPLPPRPTVPPPVPPPLTKDSVAPKAPSPGLAARLSLSGQGSQSRPKGPRPPPPPPRARQTNWFSNFTRSKSAAQSSPPVAPSAPADADEAVSPVRPNTERAQSDFPRLAPHTDEEERERIIERSSSATNIHTRPQLETSDADPSIRSNLDDSGSKSRSSPIIRSPHSQEASLPLSDVGQSTEGRPGAEEERREWTDLDLLVSRIEPVDQSDGPHPHGGIRSIDPFEGYQRISEFLGPSKSQAATPAALANLLTGLIQVDSRRTTPQGKVKLKLSLLGVRVTKCGICLSQFKNNERAVMLPMCNHSGHESCARRWFREKGNCWVCREVLPEE